MTEPENFDDELFADLYNDDDATGKAPAAPAPEQYTAVQPEAQVKHEVMNDAGPDRDYNNGDDSHMNNEEYDEDDDDDVDFNLGNGPATAVSQMHHDDLRPQSYNAPPPPPPPAKGPNAKEDG
ncbi:hypothetical protein B0H67DRAFT_202549 [Lasiosphaeris hirsuta]|uniref:Uncharacterized protein n=1 Tax=Lasiosphaeris hirsuta TaxID=260670 RepID=A0AA40E0U0_9PEZI|nr:hypothetical protein B0H67DRAFT_202549 [Lasiosphaeris hirsuta]